MKWLLLLFLLPLVVFGLFLSGLTLWFSFMFLPAWLVWSSLAVLAVFVLWLGLRGRTAAAPGSESAFIRQTSKDGLL